MRQSYRTGLTLAALGAGATGIALAPIWVRWSPVGPSATACYRLLLASPLLWLWVAVEQRRIPPPRRPANPHDFRLLAGAGAAFAVDLALWHWSIRFTSVANATLFANLAPIFVTLGALLWFKERITQLFLAGLALALLGSVLVAGVSLSLDHRHFVGDLLGVATAFFYAAYQLAVKQLRWRFTTGTVLAWSGLASLPLLCLAAWLSGEALWPETATGWAVLAALAITGQVLGQGLIAYASAHLPASFTSVVLLFQPACAGLLAWLLLGERLGWKQGLGGLVVLIGIGLAGAGRHRPRP